MKPVEPGRRYHGASPQWIGRQDGLIKAALDSGRYEVREDGSIINLRHARTGQPAPVPMRRFANGYLGCSLWVPERKRCANVCAHRVVLIAFLGMPNFPDANANHKNGDRADNRIANLEWVTRGQNIEHAYRELKTKKPVFLPGESNPAAKLSEVQVLMVRALRAAGFRNSVIAEQFGISPASVTLIEQQVTWRNAA